MADWLVRLKGAKAKGTSGAESVCLRGISDFVPALEQKRREHFVSMREPAWDGVNVHAIGLSALCCGKSVADCYSICMGGTLLFSEISTFTVGLADSLRN